MGRFHFNYVKRVLPNLVKYEAPDPNVPRIPVPDYKCQCHWYSKREAEICEMHLKAGYGRFYVTL